jgi:uncharacterized SAM-binding protein YcdF (DUF218 family)
MSASLTVSDIVRTLALPPLSLLLLVAVGLILQRWRPRLGRAMVTVALVTLYILCTNMGAILLMHPLENMSTPLSSSRDTGAQAIVVLAAGQLENAPEYGGKDIPDYIALARLRYAAKLQHETGLPILVSGGNAPKNAGRESKAESMASALRDDFVTPVRWIEGNSENTAENAIFSEKILRQHGVRRVLLVTDAMHLPRAKLAFTQTGLEVIAAPTMFFGAGSIELLDFLPSAEGIRRSRYAIYEWLGIIWYRTRYGSFDSSRN